MDWSREEIEGIVANEQVRAKTALDKVVRAAVEQPAVLPIVMDFATVKTKAPQRQFRASEPSNPLLFSGVKRDYLEREAKNQSMGLAGKDLVVQFEHGRLVELGQPRVADRVHHASQSKGDGLGYDVLSLESDGQERFIEVNHVWARYTVLCFPRRACTLQCCERPVSPQPSF